jgi:hypothetical protein
LKITRTLIFLLLSALVGAVIGSYASINKSEREASIGCINSMLYDLNLELDLLEHWNSKYKNDPILEEKIKHLILNKMIAMSAVKPDIDNLKGVPLEALYRLSNYNKNNDLSIRKYDSAFKTALDYLSTIEDDVNSIIKERKDIHKKPFK